jgi:predicted ABC-type ATPase
VADRARILVAAGTNGAGKSSIVGTFITRAGGDYYNPDERTRALIAAGLDPADANARSWADGYDRLRYAIDHKENFTFETTLGGRSICRELHRAAAAGHEVCIWYVGLASPELHLDRVHARVARGGHDIPEAKIRERYTRSLANLLSLIGVAAEIHLFDNSEDTPDGRPRARRILRMKGSRIVEPSLEGLLLSTPRWAKPVVAAAVRVHGAERRAVRLPPRRKPR